jgi:hypothetical protein
MPVPDLQRTGSSNTPDLEDLFLLANEYFSVLGLEAETLRRALNPCQHGIPFKSGLQHRRKRGQVPPQGASLPLI